MLTVGPRLYLERLRRGITQTELARRTGIAQANLSNIEKGKQDILVSTLLQICLALDVQPSSVLDASFNRPTTPRFTRARLEKLAALVADPALPADEEDREIVHLLRKTMLPGAGRRTSSKAATLHWADLRQRLTNEEIAALRQRVDDALQRKPHAKKHR
jgi:transcriptional regulator with XRE-family HTH domain